MNKRDSGTCQNRNEQPRSKNNRQKHRHKKHGAVQMATVPDVHLKEPKRLVDVLGEREVLATDIPKLGHNLLVHAPPSNVGLLKAETQALIIWGNEKTQRLGCRLGSGLSFKICLGVFKAAS